MTATAEAQQKVPLALAFEHRTAQVVIKITGRAAGNQGTLSAAKVCSPHSRYEDGAPAGESLSITPQTDTPATGEEARYTALVLPGTADGFKLFSVNVDGKEVSFTTDIAFVANHIYEYTLAIGTERVTLAGFTAKEWTESSLMADMTPQWDGQVADSYAGGDGSNSDPYQIATPGQLALFAKQVNNEEIGNNKYLKLTSDIDLGCSNWTPIGNSRSSKFASHFDGKGHTIRNLYINQSEITDEYYGYSVGLFGNVEKNASIRNLTVKNAVINITTTENGYDIGVIAGRIDIYGNAIIDNCHVAGAEITYEETDNRNTSIGGIAGYAKTDMFSNSITFSRCTVDDINVHTNSTSGDMAAGGILGWMDGGKTQIYACSASGTLTGRNACGLALCNNASILAASGCYANCTLQGNTSAAISILLKVSSYPVIQWSYLAGLQSDALRKGVEPGSIGANYTKEEECYLVTDHSKVYGIVANSANETTFTVDDTIYKVSDCWKDNGSDLPTLKVNKDGTTTE